MRAIDLADFEFGRLRAELHSNLRARVERRFDLGPVGENEAKHHRCGRLIDRLNSISGCQVCELIFSQGLSPKGKQMKRNPMISVGVTKDKRGQPLFIAGKEALRWSAI